MQTAILTTPIGFSRGAYQVRTLAAMIERVGLIYPGNQEQIPFAWEVYSNDDPRSAQFKAAFCRDKVKIHFVGVWDTVASVGVLTRKVFPLTDECGHVTYFCHALALDECRVKFLAEYVNKNSGGSVLKQVWFAGTHSDIEGGNKVNTTLDRGGEPLKWMMEEAYARGLSIRLHDVKVGLPHAEVTDSMGKWLAIEFLTGWKTYLTHHAGWSREHWYPWYTWHVTLNDKPHSSWWPHAKRAREVLPEHHIHWTVKASLELAKSKNDNSGGNKGDKAQGAPYSPKGSIWLRLEPVSNGSEAPSSEVQEAPDEELGSNLEESELGPVMFNSRRLDWDDMRDKGPVGNGPWWSDDHASSLHMVEIIGKKPLLEDGDWFEQLSNYALEKTIPGASTQIPAMKIWPYGGPQFLQYLFKIYHKHPKTVEIARAIIGFGSEIWKEPPQQSGDVLEQDIVNDPAIHPLNAPEGGDTRTARPLGSRKSRVINKMTAHPVDVQWNWNRIGRKERSGHMARAVTDILVEIAQSKYARIMQGASRELAGLVLDAISILLCLNKKKNLPLFRTGERKKRVGHAVRACSIELVDEHILVFAEGLLNSIEALFKYDAANLVFLQFDISHILRPLILTWESRPDLTLSAMRISRILVEDIRFGNEMAEFDLLSHLIGIIRSNQFEEGIGKQQLAEEAALTMAKFSRHEYIGYMFDPHLAQLFEWLREGKHSNHILEAFRNITTIYAGSFSTETIRDLTSMMKTSPDASFVLANIAKRTPPAFDIKFLEAYRHAGTVNEISELLNHENDTHVQATASLLANLIGRGEYSSPARYLSFNTLERPARSQQAVHELRRAAMQFALQDPLPGGLLAALVPSVSAGDKQAILAVLASAAYDESERQEANQHLPALFEIITPVNEILLNESMQVATVIFESGYILPDPYPRLAVERVVGIIKSANGGTLYATGELYKGRDHVLTSALELVEALCNNREDFYSLMYLVLVICAVALSEAHAIDLALLTTVALGLNHSRCLPVDNANTILIRLSSNDRYKDLINRIREETNQPEPEPKPQPDAEANEQNEDELGVDDGEPGSDEEDQETSPLLKG
ncbi:hypothetical protein RhiJN_06747 [Ceratobasidium sp. AG-Ba]|nr:hypothetical protein RhiJN_06747 [Ceratobasidium sp. AG-Ba]